MAKRVGISYFHPQIHRDPLACLWNTTQLAVDQNLATDTAGNLRLTRLLLEWTKDRRRIMAYRNLMIFIGLMDSHGFSWILMVFTEKNPTINIQMSSNAHPIAVWWKSDYINTHWSSAPWVKAAPLPPAQPRPTLRPRGRGTIFPVLLQMQLMVSTMST